MSHTSTILIVLALTLIGFTANANTYSDKQINCLAQNIYHESRGEPIDGQYAVAYVTLNRLEDPRFPDTICSVVHQRGQFEWVRKNPSIREKQAWKRAKIIAERAITLHDLGYDLTKGAIYFNSGGKRSYHRKKTFQIGNHSFFQ